MGPRIRLIWIVYWDSEWNRYIVCSRPICGLGNTWEKESYVLTNDKKCVKVSDKLGKAALAIVMGQRVDINMSCKNIKAVLGDN
jgi:hypothetical protein